MQFSTSDSVCLTGVNIQPFSDKKVFSFLRGDPEARQLYFLPWCSLLSFAPDSSAISRRRRSTVASEYRPTLRDNASPIRVSWDFMGLWPYLLCFLSTFVK